MSDHAPRNINLGNPKYSFVEGVSWSFYGNRTKKGIKQGIFFFKYMGTSEVGCHKSGDFSCYWLAFLALPSVEGRALL